MRIVLASVGTRGDIAPFVALGIGLARAGHDVTATSWDLWRDAFAGAVPFTPAGPDTTDADIAETARRAASARSPLDQVAILRDFHLRDAAAHARQLREIIGGAEVAVIHGIHSLAQAAAVDAGVPYATAVFDPVLLPTATAPPPGMPSLGPLNRGLWWMLDRMLRRLDAPLHTALARAGMPAPDLRLFRGRSKLLHLVACSPTIIGVPRDLPSTTAVIGAWVDPRPPGAPPREVEAFLSAGERPILVTFGSMASDAAAAHARAVEEALAVTRQRAIVQGLPLTASRAVCRSGPFDHRSVLQRVALAVHHGGAGTVHAVTAAGVPSIVVPHVGDQRYWALRLAQLGVAASPVGPEDFTAAALVDRITTAQRPEVREAAERLQDAMAREDGVAGAVARIGATFSSAAG